MVSDSGDGGNRSDQPKTRLIWAIIPATLVCAIIIGLGFLKAAEYEWQADKQIADYAEYTKSKKANGCVQAAKADKIVCLNAASDAYREYRYNQRDLVAQKTSALWAFIMGAAAVIGMALSAVGVWLVKTTFDETRKANDITREHQRARILPSAELARDFHSETQKAILRCENIGLSAAYRVKCFALTAKEAPKLPPIEADFGYERTIIVGEKVDLIVIDPFENENYVCGMIQYDTIFSGSQISYFCFGFDWSQQSRKWFAVSKIPDTWPRDT